MTIRPMLAAAVESLDQIRYPVAITPKLDGIRILIHPELGPVTRKLKPLPNVYARTLLETLPPGLDGELIVPNAANFGETSSALMRRTGSPDFEFHVFDTFDVPLNPYLTRVEWASTLLWCAPGWVDLLDPVMVGDESGLLFYEGVWLQVGHEGVMIRDPQGGYKFGRSTLREHGLLKLKRFEDAEAICIGVEELQRNQNEQTRDELGYAKRSSHKAGQVPGGVLGALVCRLPNGIEFKIGSGYTAAQREELLATPPIGKLIKFRFQPSGAREAPRFPTFLGIRDEVDL